MNENNTSLSFNNSGYNTDGIIGLRLKTEHILERLKNYLSGTEMVVERDENTGTGRYVKVQTGEPLCNDRGLQHLTNLVSGIINEATVQGNFTEDQYHNFVYRFHTDLSHNLIVNYINWGILEDDLQSINDFIMSLVEPFTSRLIDNKERESYSNTIRTVENSRVERDKNFISNPFGSN